MTMDEREIIREMYRKYWRYMIEKDADGLRSLMAKDYYLMHMTGVKQSAEVFLRGLLDGMFNYYSADHDDIEVCIDGDEAGGALTDGEVVYQVLFLHPAAVVHQFTLQHGQHGRAAAEGHHTDLGESEKQLPEFLHTSSPLISFHIAVHTPDRHLAGADGLLPSVGIAHH